jgi:hypothetical protein
MTGTDGGSMMMGDAGGPPPSGDAGGPPPSGDGGGPLPTPDEATIEVADSCDPLVACGGDVVGTWEYTDGCVAPDLSALRDACPGVSVDASAVARGVVRADGLRIERDVTVTTEATLDVPASCAIVGCAMIAGALADGADSASCVEAGAGCRCDVTWTDRTNDGDTYTIDGNTLRTGSGLVYDYCREGGTLVYHEQGDDGVFELSPL